MDGTRARQYPVDGTRARVYPMDGIRARQYPVHGHRARDICFVFVSVMFAVRVTQCYPRSRVTV